MKLQQGLLTASILLICLMVWLVIDVHLLGLIVLYTAMTGMGLMEARYFIRTSSKPLWLFSQGASGLIGGIALFTGLIGVALGTVVGRDQFGLWLGLLFGTVLGGTCLLMGWVGCLTLKWLGGMIHNPLQPMVQRPLPDCFNGRLKSLARICEGINTADLNRRLVYLVLFPAVKGFGLGTVVFFAAYEFGVMSLVLTLIWWCSVTGLLGVMTPGRVQRIQRGPAYLWTAALFMSGLGLVTVLHLSLLSG